MISSDQLRPTFLRSGLIPKLGLILFGIILGLVSVEVALRLLQSTQKGTEFGSWNDVRKAILTDADASSQKSSNERIDDIQTGNLKAIVNPNQNDKIIFDLRPNLKTSFQKVPLETNSCGMRGPEVIHHKPPNTFRIALLGDSFAFGWGVKYEESFAKRLEDNLNRVSAGKRKYEVLNFAVPGYSTFQEVAKFEETGLEFEPDAILVFFVQNDFGLPFYVRDIYRPGNMLAATEFARLSWKMLDPQIEEQRLQLLGYDPNSALKRLNKLSRKNGIRLFLTINPRKDWEKDFNKLWVLKRNGIEYIDMRPGFEEMMERRKVPEEELTLAHDPHPSALRHAMYGDLLTPFFMYSLS